VSLRSSIKGALFRALEIGGADKLCAGYRRDSLLVVCYHGVVSHPRPVQSGEYHYDTVPAVQFRRQLEVLSKWYRFVSLNEATEWLVKGSSGGIPPVLVTFDDGYRNNLSVAAPILRQLGVPAVFFLTTNYVGTPRILWPAEIGLRVEHSAGRRVPIPGQQDFRIVPSTKAEQSALGYRIRRLCKYLPNRARVGYLEKFRSATHLNPDAVDQEINSFMSWDEARQLASLGFDIGSHTMEHPILSRLDPDELCGELLGSKSKLEAELGMTVRTLAYPNGGAEDLSPAVMAEAERAGYSNAFAVGDTFHNRHRSPMAIRRMIIPGEAPASFFYFIASGCRDVFLRKSQDREARMPGSGEIQ
jgi:peptidoglycan/xylan/chitin deacetylase (PgdA/CDA1 family)